MDDAIFGASASIPAVKYDGNILRGVSNKPLKATMSGEGAFPKKLLVSGQNLVKMPTSGSKTVKGLTCKFWGVPWLDLGGDPQVSLNIGGRRNGSSITPSKTAKSSRSNQFQISSGNSHPNAAGNRWRYTALQEFLRRL